ncbi:hypothetical protein C8J57DRAFT_1576646 [Mycena rebaudengoi]|nr:hypothetical protein C8J57DRAFT_1576646 [Mycena rebaudengoi]
MAEDSDPLRDNNQDGYRNPLSTPRAVPPPPNPFFMPAPMPFYHSPATPGTGSFMFSPQPYPYLVSSYPPPLAPRSRTLLAVAFTGELFNGIVPGTSPRRQKRIFQWPIDVVTTEDRLLVVIRAIRKAGFPTIDSFLAVLFERKYNKHSSVSSSIASFLRGAEDDPTHHPVAIVNLIFHHVKSQRWTAGITEEPSFSLPRHALRPSLRLDSNLIPPGSNSTRNALIDWALNIILVRADTESNRLLDPTHEFVRLPGTEAWTWDKILGAWSMQQSQETVARVAPAVFAVGATVAVNSRARRKIENAVSGSAASAEAGAPASFDAPGQSVSADLPFFSGNPSVPAPADGESSQAPEWPEPEPDTGSNDDEEESGASLNFPSPLSTKIGQRDSWQAVTACILMLLYFRYRFALVFLMLIGLFAFTCNANRELVSLLCRLGLAVSYQTTLATLSVLAVDSDAQLRLLGTFPIDLSPGFLLLFDNVNKMQRAWQAHLGHKDELTSGTAATVIELEDMPPGAMRNEPLIEKIKEKVRLKLTVKQMHDDINWEHIRGIGAATVLRIWLKYVPSLAHHRAGVEALFTTKHAKHRLRLRKRKIHTACPTNIDESTTVGAASVLRNLVIGQLFMLPISLFKWMIMICGDQLSIDRIRKIIRYTAKGDTPYEQHKWALPIIQLSHLKWAWKEAIFKLHWYSELEKGTFGLHHDCVVMERDKFNHEKCDFYPAHHILEDRFESVVLDALHDCTFDELHSLASTVYDRYMCSAAADDALGHTDRDLEIYGESWSGFTGYDEPEMVTNPCPWLKSPEKEVFEDSCQRSATAEGDIGRVFEVLKLLRFSFWGAGSTNYGNELLELTCNFLLEYSDDLKTAVLNNYLVNPSGLAGHWLPLDLLQEHFNFWIKRLFNSKSHNFDSTHLADRVGLNISGISDLREKFPGLFGLKRNGQRHTDATTIHDINQLGSRFRKNHILEYDAGRDQPYQVSNEFGISHSKLLNGQLETFLTRTAGGGPATGGEEEPTTPSQDSVPATPITMTEGIMDLRAFVTGN